MLKCGIIGLGGLGKLHFKNLCEMEQKNVGVKLTSLCDIEESRFTEKVNTNLGSDTSIIDMARYHTYTDAKNMLENEELDFVISALPTYIHAEMAVLALNSGVHVFSEKPMALTVQFSVFYGNPL